MKTKTKFYALLLALGMFLLSLFGLGGAIRAHADNKADIFNDYVFPEYVPDWEYVSNPDESLTSLYYFSDYEGSEECFENGYIRDYIDMNPYITHSEIFFLYPDFCEQFILKLTTGEIPNIENAFIIFEARYSLPWEEGIYTTDMSEEDKYAHYYETFYWELEQIFSIWKANNCKIMFISGTDDVWYETYLDGFLEHVDIEVNIDLITDFTYSLVCDVIEQHGGFSGSVMIFDSFTSQDSYFRGFFLPYIVWEYYEDYGNRLSISPITEYEQYFIDWRVAEIVYALGMTAYFYDNDLGTFTNYLGDPVDSDRVFRDFDYAEYSCIVAGTQSLYDDNIWDLYESSEYRAGFYLFNDLGWSIPDDEIPEGIRDFGISSERLKFYLSVITRDFILNDYNSLFQYYNWPWSRCKITFKPIFPGDDGWLRIPPEAFGIPIW